MNRIHASIVIAALACAASGATADESNEESEPSRELYRVVAEKPGGLAFDGDLLWIADRVELKIRGLDPKTGRQRAELDAPGPWPTGLAFDGKLLWVGDRQLNRLFGVNTRSKIVEVEVEAPTNPLGLAFDGTYLWVADGKRIHQVMREDGTTIVSFNAPPWSGKGRGMEQLGLAFHDGYLWVSDRKADKLYQVEPKRGDVIDLMPSPGPFPAGLAVVDGRLLIADVDARAVQALDIGALPRVVRRHAKHQTAVLRRHITNRGPGTLDEVHIYIAVPHSVPSQALDDEPTFTPEPTGFVEDRWGQRFAHFEGNDLRPGDTLSAEMMVDATLFAVRYHIDPDRVGSLRSIPRDLRKQYLADAAKFAIEHPSIKTHLKQALDGEKRPYWMVRKIARYIGEHMEYELAGGWNIAPTVIDRGTGSCSEYTFVFIAMCRAAGIPARYAGAVVIRGDDASTDDVFHRWAEVYLPGYGWVTADAQAADKPTPEKQGEGLGSLRNRFLITTWGGGDSEYIGWDYNSRATWTCRGRCAVEDLHLGDWFPAAQDVSNEK
jgi:transglutaminase-like putative cysteine protease